MANYKTGAQRYNDRMDKIFKKSEELGNHTLHGSSEFSKAKSEALKKKKSPSQRQKRFEKYLETHPVGNQPKDRQMMRIHNRLEYDKPEYD